MARRSPYAPARPKPPTFDPAAMQAIEAENNRRRAAEAAVEAEARASSAAFFANSDPITQLMTRLTRDEDAHADLERRHAALLDRVAELELRLDEQHFGPETPAAPAGLITRLRGKHD